MWSAHSLTLIRSEIIVPVRDLFMGQIELFNLLIVCKQMIDFKVNC